MKVIGFLVGAAGVVLAVYLGVFVFLVGGIVDILDELDKETTDNGVIAWGVVKILFAETAAVFVGLLSVMLGITIASIGED